jgi:hypothetical protein
MRRVSRTAFSTEPALRALKLTSGILVLSLVACAEPEAQVIDHFLKATKDADLAALADTSMVPFPLEPQAWKVLRVSESRRGPFLISELSKAFQKSREERNRIDGEARRFREANEEELVRATVHEQSGSNAPLEPAQAKLIAEWDEHRRKAREARQVMAEARNRLELERDGARKSVSTWKLVDELDGDEEVKDVLVSVDVGEPREKQFLFTLKRYHLSDSEDGATLKARWIILGIEEQKSLDVTEGA